MLSRLTVPKMGKDKQEDASHNRDIDYTIHALSFSLFLLFLALIILFERAVAANSSEDG